MVAKFPLVFVKMHVHPKSCLLWLHLDSMSICHGLGDSLECYCRDEANWDAEHLCQGGTVRIWMEIDYDKLVGKL